MEPMVSVLKQSGILVLLVIEFLALFCFLTSQGDSNLIIFFAIIVCIISTVEALLVWWSSRMVAYIVIIQASLQALLLISVFFEFLLDPAAPSSEEWRTYDPSVVHMFLLFAILLTVCQVLKILLTRRTIQRIRLDTTREA